MTTTTLVVTNDFPPRLGGIEGFVAAACTALDHDVVVLTSTEGDLAATRRHDATLPYEVVRLRGPLLPTPSVAAVARGLLRARGASRVLYGAAAPLGLLAPGLRRAGADRHLGLTHGHEVWWATVPGARTLLVRIVAVLDQVGVISNYTGARIAAALPPASRTKLVAIPPPVDLDRFVPLDDAGTPGPVVVAAGRMISQKGFRQLLEVWPLVRATVPGATLLLAGAGPEARALSARSSTLHGVRFVGPVPYDAMPGLLASARVFALPVRTRWGGLNAEGLGRVFLEAAASGLPVIVGRSGGAPETVVDGLTGSVVDPDDPAALADAMVRWLSDPEAARAAGRAGRALVADRYDLTRVGATIRRCLDVEAPRQPGAGG